MENLPFEMVAEICQYLTVHDMISCCAVSKTWRSAFDQDWLWKRHCRQDLEEFLRTTPCTVEPVFVSPQPETSSLTPICQWRIAYMRQNHLWNNWRTGNYKSLVTEDHFNDGLDLVDPMEAYLWHVQAVFFKEHYLVKIFKHKIETWDLRYDPALKVGETLHSFPDWKPFWRVRSNLDMIIVTNETRVQVFKLQNASMSFGLTNVFYFDESLKLKDNTPEIAIKKCRFASEDIYIATVETILLGVFPPNTGNSLLHVWDLENGVKLREEVSPKNGTKILNVEVSVTSKNLLVLCGSFSRHEMETSEEELDGNYFYCIYNPHRLSFYQFMKANVTEKTFGALNKDYLLCYNDDSLTIYNFKTSQQLCSISLNVHIIEVIDEGFILNDFHDTVHTFNISNCSWKSYILSKKILCFQTLCGNFMRVQFQELEVPTFAWEMGSKVQQTNMPLYQDTDIVRSNRSCTRILLKDELVGQCIHTIRSFW
ncbi:hypothetical protein J6590_033226 [Homalodisca vitripennis]|nr:hypothetical protein J6590_033226 [Homalodisca vitripennis]